MKESNSAYESIDGYITTFSPKVQEILLTLRKVIKEEAPEAKEKISYQMPTFELHGNLVHFAAFKKHIGFYPTPSGIEAFQEELKGYKQSKGAVQFPIDQPLPYDAIRKIVQYRVASNMEKAAAKSKKKKEE
ncbi:iron chaperone [Paenibacillus sp. 1001270B_150601_E10]|uniref:iron chaperone n=1 Tax=Paenibacillus sp. 1001270B_150601_E10 TaxID=2787079 RepID=UPI0018A06BCC|nr:DUF1801 domain-containing protein [Paenibacillus sp. 1001270B_150601_E10]